MYDDASAAVTTFENIVVKGEIAQNEQFRLLPQSFQLSFPVIMPTIIEILHTFEYTFFKIVDCRFVVSGKRVI